MVLMGLSLTQEHYSCPPLSVRSGEKTINHEAVAGKVVFRQPGTAKPQFLGILHLFGGLGGTWVKNANRIPDVFPVRDQLWVVAQAPTLTKMQRTQGLMIR
jgi:hypothetical protein